MFADQNLWTNITRLKKTMLAFDDSQNGRGIREHGGYHFRPIGRLGGTGGDLTARLCDLLSLGPCAIVDSDGMYFTDEAAGHAPAPQTCANKANIFHFRPFAFVIRFSLPF